MKKPQKSRSISGKSVLLCIKAWSKRSLYLWGMLTLLMASGCRNPQPSVTKKGPEPNRAYTRQQSALSAEPSKPSLSPQTSSPTKAATNTPDTITQRPTVPMLQPNQSAQSRTTKTIVLGSSPTSRPTATFETILLYEKYTDNKKIEEVKVYGETRPKIVVMRLKDNYYYTYNILFLNDQLQVQKKLFSQGELAVDPHGNGILLGYQLLDSNGNVKWQHSSRHRPLEGIPQKLFVTPNLARTLAFYRVIFGDTRGRYLLLLDEKGQKIEDMLKTKEGEWFDIVDVEASPDRKSFVYWQGTSKGRQLIRTSFANPKEIHWKKSLARGGSIPRGITQLLAGNRMTAIASFSSQQDRNESKVSVFDERGKLLWQKAGEAHISFWPNETRMGVGGELLDTHTGTKIPYKNTTRLERKFLGMPKRWMLDEMGNITHEDGTRYNLNMGQIGNPYWLVNCHIIYSIECNSGICSLIKNQRVLGLYRGISQSLQSLVSCDEGSQK